MARLTVVDAAAPAAAACSVELEPGATLDDLHTLCLSLALPSAAAALRAEEQQLVICHDGRKLYPGESWTDTTEQLASMLLEAPVIVVFAQAAAPPAPRHTTSDSTAAAAATSAAAAAAATSVATAAAAPAAAASIAAAPTAAAAPPPPPRTGRRSRGPPPGAVCRICFGEAFEGGTGRLISPCLCSGSMRYVHTSCLNEWRAASANARSLAQCDYCHYQYDVTRTDYAALLESARAARLVSGLLLLCSVLGAAALLGPLGAARPLYRLLVFDPSSPYHSGELVARLWCWQLDWLVAGLVGVGAVGLGLAVRTQYLLNRHVDHAWLVGVVTALASNDTRIWRVFVAFGFVQAGRALVGIVEAYARELLAKWGSAILEAPRDDDDDDGGGAGDAGGR